MFELSETEERMKEKGELSGSGVLDAVFVTCVGGSTPVGMIAGTKLLQNVQAEAGHVAVSRKIVSIDASGKDIMAQRQLLLGIAKRTTKLIGLDENDLCCR